MTKENPADPGAIEAIKKRRTENGGLASFDVDTLFAAVEALRARVEELEHNIKVWKWSLAIETDHHFEQRDLAEAEEARVLELEGALKALLHRVDTHFDGTYDWKEQEHARSALSKRERKVAPKTL